jgi:predicted PurR-regulated permease PerM
LQILVKKLIKRLEKKKRIITIVSSGIVSAVVLVGVGYYIGNGRIEFGNGHLISINFSSSNGLPATLNYAAIQQEYTILKDNFDGNLTTQQLQNG